MDVDGQFLHVVVFKLGTQLVLGEGPMLSCWLAVRKASFSGSRAQLHIHGSHSRYVCVIGCVVLSAVLVWHPCKVLVTAESTSSSLTDVALMLPLLACLCLSDKKIQNHKKLLVHGV
jgi:hypothetical protein